MTLGVLAAITFARRHDRRQCQKRDLGPEPDFSSGLLAAAVGALTTVCPLRNPLNLYAVMSMSMRARIVKRNAIMAALTGTLPIAIRFGEG